MTWSTVMREQLGVGPREVGGLVVPVPLCQSKSRPDHARGIRQYDEEGFGCDMDYADWKVYGLRFWIRYYYSIAAV